MRIKRCIAASLLVGSMCLSSSITVYGQNVLSTKTLPNEITSNFPLTTVDGQKVQIPKKNFNLKKENSNVKSFSADGFSNTKKVAEEKASALININRDTSVQYALIDNGKIVLSGNAGVYSKENNTLLTADNMYGIGSVSKMFTTTAVMKLVDEGKVNLDTPVTHYINDFTMADKRYKKITVRMLLNHSSGLMGTCMTNIILFGDNDTYVHDTLLKQLKTQRLKADPGEYSVYCNDGFTLAEILVERVTGTSFTDYIAKNITNPLKMEDTKTPVSEFDRTRLAKTYYSGIPNALPAENANFIGAGGIYSSAEDLCTFGTTFTNNSNEILSKNSIKAMQNKEYLRGIWPKDAESESGYGLGWDTVNTYPFNQYNIKALSKAGDTYLYHSNLTVLPDQNMAVAVVSSGGDSTTDELMANKVLLAALKEKGIISKIKPDKTFSAPKKVKVPVKIKKYEGSYISVYGFINVKIKKTGTLNITNYQMPNYGKQTLVYTKKGVFVSKDGKSRIKFVNEKNGKTYLEETDYINVPSLGQVVSDEYFAQKEKINKLKKSVANAWAKRDGKNYYMLNEKYSSAQYMRMCPYARVGFTKGLEGYLGGDKIVNDNSAIAILDGPGQMSRDQSDYDFYKKDNVEYLSTNSGIYIEENAIGNLPTDSKFTCNIGEDGYAKWYKIGKEVANKEVTIALPDKAAFVVYNSDKTLVEDSLITGSNTVVLPKDGMIVFLGSPKANFTVQYNTASK
ncbi:serine hydrolase domain-containing protein [Clostridium oryzae]|uniref:D-alanyl-D-alanine-carboxypeptidase/endopeptidase AmpH n=1 Tax=Clostridium oryzae TaxID=1450648 RepID=A0A1V4IR28_9CLOT|nr:serine hydrolase domain-containing protein [Clostridium oryzae]OPJ62245.1 D-alanyl-D-alanine-carboxypeptidase/endopeptidase AmpH precursor [Clostridium oryzae]